MRFRTGLVVGGIAGFFLGRRLAERQGELRSADVQQAMARHPSSPQGEAWRLAERAALKGTEAIQRARASIQKRIEGDGDEAYLNN